MRALKIVLNKSSEKPRVIKIDYIAMITTSFSNTTDDFNEDTGYNDLFITVPNYKVLDFMANYGDIANKVNKVIPDHTTFLIWCSDYTIMN